VYRRAYSLLIGIAAVMAIATYVVHLSYHRPILDPEGSFLGPSYVRLPLLLGLALAIDLVPRTLWLSRGRPTALWPLVKDRWHSHWNGERILLVFLGVASFYLTYVGYRNLKSYLPFVRSDPTAGPGEVKALSYDRELHALDRVLFFGHDPSDVTHALLGTWTAHVLSPVYLFFLPLVPIVITLWVVWSRNISFGYWFVTSQCLCWALGTASYYLLPTLGPGIWYAAEYNDLPRTSTSELMASIASTRGKVLYAGASDSVNSIAGFASLHTCITLAVALLVQYTIRNKVLRIACWVYFALVVISTIYFGWHYVADDIAGAAIAIFSVWLGGVASGQKFDPGFRSHPTTTTSKVPVDQD